jgi:hypothetical protein
MPSAAALKRGSAAAAAILDAHRKANGGAYPETVAVNLWGLDAIKTKGESVAIALYLVRMRLPPARQSVNGFYTCLCPTVPRRIVGDSCRSTPTHVKHAQCQVHPDPRDDYDEADVADDDVKADDGMKMVVR